VAAADVFQGLNAEQRRAVEKVRGPVCILAGAGTGKTTTITHRIANQVLTGAFEPGAILAVTFTDKAAGEMRERLASLGVPGARARTFHSAALAQLRHLSVEPPGQILASKVVAVRQLANSLPKPYRFRSAADLATEIEWARNRRLTPATYQDGLRDHEPPIPEDLMHRIFRDYEAGKRERGLIDFEDLLELAIRMYETDEDALNIFMARYQAFTVDEYQDVNLLQQSLLDLWLSGRDDICVVGDDYQSIYSFTGASARYLIEMPQRFVRTTVVKLEENHRSTPEILAFANKLVPNLGGTDKVLRSTKPSAEAVRTQRFFDTEREQDAIIGRVRELQAAGLPYNEMAILYRANFRSEDFEEAFTAAGIPFQVRGGAFLSRRGAQQVLKALRRPESTQVAAEVLSAAQRAGYVEEPPDGVGEAELTRQKDLARLVRIAEAFDDGTRTVADLVEDLRARFGEEATAIGVNLLTYHRAKGLEFDAVFLPRLEEGELPFKRSRTDEAIAEERRLLYVGLTRARDHLWLSWTASGRSQPSRFLEELGLVFGATPVEKSKSSPAVQELDAGDRPVFEELKKWRLRRSQQDSVPAYVVFHDSVLADIARRKPTKMRELAVIPGVGTTKLERYGPELLTILTQGPSENPTKSLS
jgi:DNA helicase II / ATP-dependent DNA helicase PcrA